METKAKGGQLKCESREGAADGGLKSNPPLALGYVIPVLQGSDFPRQ